MRESNSAWFRKGLADGVPIALGYLAVSFSLGIAAKNAGLTWAQATIMSLLNNASAGEFAAFGIIAAGAPYSEMAVTTLIINLRYLLMSCALSQKLDAGAPLRHRLLIGYDVTDEIFGVSVSVPGKLNPWYTFGAIAVAVPGWSVGTLLGVVMGEVLPGRVVSALSVALYGMFIAIIVPPARKSRAVAVVVAVSMALSFAAAKLPLFGGISPGMRIILLTVAIAAIAAFVCPVKGEEHAA